MVRFSVQIFVILIIVNGCSGDLSDTEPSKELRNSHKIQILLRQSDSTNLNDSIRYKAAIEASKIAKDSGIDSLISKSLLKLVILSYPLKYKDSFLLYYPQSLNFAEKIHDTLSIAETHNYTAYFYLREMNIDSAYFHFYQGSKYFNSIHDNFQTGKMLLNMAIIQKNQRDYKGSEEVTQQALEHLLETNDKRYISSAYNNLGIVNNGMKKLPISIKYHKKALSLRKDLKDKNLLVVKSMNNIAVAYKDNGDFEKAFAYFDSIQPYMNLMENNPIDKARFIDNLAHNRLLSGEIDGVLTDMKLALSIRQREHHLTGIMVSLLHISEYYQITNDYKKSFKYALEAKKMSGEHQNYRDALRALRMLTLNESNEDNKEFVKEYYSIVDELEKVENSVSDGFARIRFEADEKERENKRATKLIKKQINLIKSKNLIIGLLVFATLLFLGLLYVVWKVSKYRRELYREFNHRTKNNLIEIQRGILKAKKADNKMGSILYLESVTQSQLLLYSLLEKKEHPSHILIGSYIKELISSLLLVYKEYETSFQIDMTLIKIDSKRASLIGLIVNEFITNAFKYSFVKGKENSVEVSCSSSKSDIIITINASGKEWNPEISVGKGDGLILMRSLAKKIPATINIFYREEMTFLILNLKV